jgi:hypothetical protein
LNICKSAIDVIDEVDYDGCDAGGNGRIKNPQTIMQWYCLFHDNNAQFPNPGVARLRQKTSLPLLFHNNPDLYTSFMTLNDYLFTIALPEAVSRINKSKH